MAERKADSDGVTLQGLLAERVANDAGQAAAISALGVSQSIVSRWVKGDVVPSDDKVPALADFLTRSEDEVALLLSQARRRRQGLAERVSALEDQVRELTQLVRDLTPQRKR